MIFAPVPVLTVTIEEEDGRPDVHLHAGGQGVWQARVLSALRVPTVLCGCFGGETGAVLRELISCEGIDARAVHRTGRNSAYVHDRRGGSRATVAQSPGDPVTRHEMDQLYNVALAEGLSADVCLLSGPAEPHLVRTDVYRRLSHDLRANGRRVVVDLTGKPLGSCLCAGVDVLKISHEELIADGRAERDEPAELVAAMRRLREEGADTVVVSREGRPALVLIGDEVHAVPLPDLEPVEPRGAGDSMTAGISAGLATGLCIDDAIRLGVAAGALNVTRHGLGTVDPRAAHRLAQQVELHPLEGGERQSWCLSPRELAERTRP
ncbi:phosphofructokinase [Actinomadura craniellae]|uniref:Phosphofructokinase n=2 Tax=Actinomadura craniellae TaxID=2231787 RepID=A0A365HAE9_9ACTN|nr:phosphofructokinase [Actinomadura craniellae]